MRRCWKRRDGLFAFAMCVARPLGRHCSAARGLSCMCHAAFFFFFGLCVNKADGHLSDRNFWLAAGRHATRREIGITIRPKPLPRRCTLWPPTFPRCSLQPRTYLPKRYTSFHSCFRACQHHFTRVRLFAERIWRLLASSRCTPRCCRPNTMRHLLSAPNDFGAACVLLRVKQAYQVGIFCPCLKDTITRRRCSRCPHYRHLHLHYPHHLHRPPRRWQWPHRIWAPTPCHQLLRRFTRICLDVTLFWNHCIKKSKARR